MGVLIQQAQTTTSRTNKMTAAREVTTSVTPAESPIEDAAYVAARDFNATFDWETSKGLPTHTTDLPATVRDNPVLPHGNNSPGTVRWQLDSGAALTPKKGVITYAFLDSSNTTGMYNRPQEGFTEGLIFSSFSSAQRAATVTSMQNWDDLIAPTIKQVNGTGGADIVLANTQTGPAQAWAYVPYDYAEIYANLYGPKYNSFHRYQKFVGDVWIADPAINGSNAQLLPGQYGTQTLNHEIGHSLGLSHPGSYDFGDDQDGDGQPDPITYPGDAQYFQDSHQYTIMSYFDSYETGAQPIDWNLMRLLYPSTPMVDDVFVIQQKYGADMTTRTGNTTYGFNSTADVTNEAMKFKTGEAATIFTIWDAKGNDTLDLSGYYTPSVIDLREGAYSSAGGWGAYNPALLSIDPSSLPKDELLAIINGNNAAAGLGARVLPTDHPLGYDYYYRLYFTGGVRDYDADFNPIEDEDGNPLYLNGGLAWADITGSRDSWLMQQNIGIAYGAIIEDAKGGHGNDRINGNQATNHFWGNGGADTFIIADYSGVVWDPTDSTDWKKTVNDVSVDSIMDFNRDQGDKIDVSELGVTSFGQLTFNDATDTVTATVGTHVEQFKIIGASSIQASDFIFG